MRKAFTVSSIDSQEGRPERVATFLTAHSTSFMTLLLHFCDKPPNPRLADYGIGVRCRSRRAERRRTRRRAAKSANVISGPRPPKITHRVRNAPNASLAVSVRSWIFG